MSNESSSQRKNEQNSTILDLNSLWFALKSRKLMIGIIVLIGLIIMSTVGFLRKPVYVKGTLISIPYYKKSIVNSAEIIAMIQDVGALIERDAKDILVQKGVFREEDIDSILGIYCPAADMTEETFILAIKSQREENIPNIARDTIRYLNSNEIISARIEEQKSLMSKQVEFFKTAVTNAEALKTTFLELSRKEIPLDLSFNVVEIEKTIRDMKLELENIQKELTLFKGFEMISTLDAPPKRTSFNFPRNIIIGGAIFLFLGIIIALFLEWKNYIL